MTPASNGALLNIHYYYDKTRTPVDCIFPLYFLPQITKSTRVTISAVTLLDHIY